MWIIYLNKVVIKKLIESFSSQRRDAQAITSELIWPPLWSYYVQSAQFSFPIFYVYFLEKEMAIHSSILAWRIPWMEEPSRLQSMGSQRVGLLCKESQKATSFTHSVSTGHLWNAQSPSVASGCQSRPSTCACDCLTGLPHVCFPPGISVS